MVSADRTQIVNAAIALRVLFITASIGVARKSWLSYSKVTNLPKAFSALYSVLAENVLSLRKFAIRGSQMSLIGAENAHWTDGPSA